jgi:hypothetical protein
MARKDSILWALRDKTKKPDALGYQPLDSNLMRQANQLYGRLPAYLRYAVDEDPESGLEPEEIPDGYDRLRDQDVPFGGKP